MWPLFLLSFLTLHDRLSIIAIMNRLSTEKRAHIIACLVEGNSVRATCRMTGAAKGTVLKLLRDVGAACAIYQDNQLRNLSCKRLQADEIWSFCYSKARNVPADHKGEYGYGDVWTWVAIDADTKLVPTWFIGTRDADSAMHFVSDLKKRLSNYIQLTTDGHKAYLSAVESSFGPAIDYAMLVKIYRAAPGNEQAVRYSPAECIGARAEIITGNPNPANISTSART